MWTSWSSGGYVVEVLPGLSHKWTVCSKVKVFRPETPFSYNNNPSTETFCRVLLFGQWRYYTQKIALCESIESTLSLSLLLIVMYTFYSISIQHREREREWMSADIVILFRFVKRGRWWSGIKEGNQSHVYIHHGRKYLFHRKKSRERERLKIFFFFFFN